MRVRSIKAEPPTRVLSACTPTVIDKFSPRKQETHALGWSWSLSLALSPLALSPTRYCCRRRRTKCHCLLLLRWWFNHAGLPTLRSFSHCQASSSLRKRAFKAEHRDKGELVSDDNCAAYIWGKVTGWMDGDRRGFLMGAFNVTRARGTEFVVLLGDAYGRRAS